MLVNSANISTLNKCFNMYNIDEDKVGVVRGEINFLIFLGNSITDITPDDCIGYTTLDLSDLEVGQEFNNPFGDGVLTINLIDNENECVLVDLHYV